MTIIEQNEPIKKGRIKGRDRERSFESHLFARPVLSTTIAKPQNVLLHDIRSLQGVDVLNFVTWHPPWDEHVTAAHWGSRLPREQALLHGSLMHDPVSGLQWSWVQFTPVVCVCLY